MKNPNLPTITTLFGIGAVIIYLMSLKVSDTGSSSLLKELSNRQHSLKVEDWGSIYLTHLLKEDGTVILYEGVCTLGDGATLTSIAAFSDSNRYPQDTKFLRTDIPKDGTGFVLYRITNPNPASIWKEGSHCPDEAYGISTPAHAIDACNFPVQCDSNLEGTIMINSYQYRYSKASSVGLKSVSKAVEEFLTDSGDGFVDLSGSAAETSED